jgi:magnesium transporter
MAGSRAADGGVGVNEMDVEPVLVANFDEVTSMIDRLENDTASLAEMVLSPTRLYRDERIYDLLKQAMRASRAVTAAGLPADNADPERVDLLRTRMRQTRDDLVLLLQAHQMRCHTLEAQVNARQAEIGTRQNDDMRKISAWAAIVAVPTLITGVYGMNFESMPELGWVAGYPMVISGIVGISVGLYAYFRRIKWL